jgi:Holliday junction resolvase-like predicted endonuclease
MKKLPIGIQTFKDIIVEDYIYIDKTKEALELIEHYKYTFLSRPRRFGKSLFLDTLHNIFEAKKEYFKDLYIYDKWDWNTTYPVIKISWAGDFSTEERLVKRAKQILKDNQERLQVECEDDDYLPNCLWELIKQTYKKYNQKVVILIDEYDKPILDTIEHIEQSKINREFIKSLYTIIKDSDEYIKFAFLTGVSKFSKASIFSGLNMLTDISLDEPYGNICGYTQANVENEFKDHMQGADLEKVKEWYNGYNFLKDNIYNPFDILQFLTKNKKFSNYWFETATPTFLIKLIEKNNYFLPKLSNLTVGESLLSSFDIENIDLEVILYQSGYLTIDKMIIDEDDDIIYHLKLPNLEVKKSFNIFIINHLYKDTSLQNKNLSRTLRNNDLESFKNSLISIFASIPYNNIQNYEGFYASVVYVYLQSLGLEIIGEDVTNLGRIDLTVKINNLIYIIEFKVGNEDGLAQIKEKKYYQKYLQEKKDIYLIGINFDKNDKNIKEFQWEKL